MTKRSQNDFWYFYLGSGYYVTGTIGAMLFIGGNTNRYFPLSFYDIKLYTHLLRTATR